MNRFSKPLLALLTLLLLLTACSPPASTPTPSPVPTMPTPTADGGILPRPDDDPLDIWRGQSVFRDTKIVPWKAVNFPVLIVENLELDWGVLAAFAAAQVPDGVQWLDWEGWKEKYEIPDSDPRNMVTSKGRPHYMMLESDAYETDHGRESAGVVEEAYAARYCFFKRFEDPDSIAPQAELPYSEQEAIDMVLTTLVDLGVPVDELELQFVMKYDRTVGALQSGPEMYGVWINSGDEAGYVVRFRHMLYDIPVYDQYYEVRNDPADFESGGQSFPGHSANGIVTHLGLRNIQIRFRRVIEIERHDVPILPLSDVVDMHLDMIRRPGIGPISRIELMLAPTHYESEDPVTQARLTPAWCFFYNGGEIIIDASTGITLRPSVAEWEYQKSQP